MELTSVLRFLYSSKIGFQSRSNPIFDQRDIHKPRQCISLSDSISVGRRPREGRTVMSQLLEELHRFLCLDSVSRSRSRTFCWRILSPSVMSGAETCERRRSERKRERERKWAYVRVSRSWMSGGTFPREPCMPPITNWPLCVLEGPVVIGTNRSRILLSKHVSCACPDAT